MSDEKFNINELDPVKLPDHPKVKESFLKAYSKIHLSHVSDKEREAQAESIYDKEALYYKKLVTASEKLKQATRVSLYSAFLEVAIQGLSLQPGQKSESYLEARSFNAGTRDKPVWQQVCNLVITAYGELNLRIKAGQITRMSNPVIIYEGDHFQPMTNPRGELYVDFKPSFPRKSEKIVGCWVAIHLPSNAIDFKWLEMGDVERLKKYSEKGMGGKANALYNSHNGQIDPGFLSTKCIKHAMAAYTKLRVGDNVAFEGEIEASEAAKETFAPPAEKENTVNYGHSDNGHSDYEMIPEDDDGEIF